jgi:hypothetical protein
MRSHPCSTLALAGALATALLVVAAPPQSLAKTYNASHSNTARLTRHQGADAPRPKPRDLFRQTTAQHALTARYPGFAPFSRSGFRSTFPG